MNCIIVDDNKLARFALTQMLDGIQDLNLIGEFENAMDANNFLMDHAVDLLLLDVEMPGMTGLELISCLETKPLIVLISSKAEYAVDGFDFEVMDYLVKPVSVPRLVKSINRALSIFNQSKSNDKLVYSDHFFVRANNQLQKIEIDEILFVEAMGDYVNIQTVDSKNVIHSTLKSIEDRLPKSKFTRVHRGYIVATNKITNIEQNSLLIGKHMVPISEAIKQELLNKINIL